MTAAEQEQLSLSYAANQVLSDLFKTASWFGVEESVVTVLRAAGGILDEVYSPERRETALLGLLVSSSADRSGLELTLDALRVGAIDVPGLDTDTPERKEKAEQGFDLPWLKTQAAERMRALAAQYPHLPLERVLASVVGVAGRVMEFAYTPRYRDTMFLWAILQDSPEPEQLQTRLRAALRRAPQVSAEPDAATVTSSGSPIDPGPEPSPLPRPWISRSKKNRSRDRN